MTEISLPRLVRDDDPIASVAESRPFGEPSPLGSARARVVQALFEAHHGRVELLEARPGDVRLALDDLDGRRQASLSCALLMIDYNSYTTSRSMDCRAEATAIPRAALIEVLEWPAPKVSNSLSLRFRKPESPPWRRIVCRWSRRPVRILCG